MFLSVTLVDGVVVDEAAELKLHLRRVVRLLYVNFVDHVLLNIFVCDLSHFILVPIWQFIFRDSRSIHIYFVLGRVSVEILKRDKSLTFYAACRVI